MATVAWTITATTISPNTVTVHYDDGAGRSGNVTQDITELLSTRPDATPEQIAWALLPDKYKPLPSSVKLAGMLNATGSFVV